MSSELKLFSSVFQLFSSVLKPFSSVLKLFSVQTTGGVQWYEALLSVVRRYQTWKTRKHKYKRQSQRQQEGCPVCSSCPCLPHCCGEMSDGFVSWQIHLDNSWKCLWGAEAVFEWVMLKLSALAGPDLTVRFLSDPGIPGVWSMGPSVSNWVSEGLLLT